MDRLTERIGVITDELRAFSRKTRSETVAAGIDEAEVILPACQRIAQASVKVSRGLRGCRFSSVP